MSTSETSPFRKKGFIAAAVVVGAIFLAAIIVFVTSLLGPNDPPSNTSPSPTDSTPSAEPVEDPSTCGLEGFEAESTLEDAPDTTWELVGSVAAPTDSKGAGPGVIDDDGFRTCYAHTAEGALYAAVNYIALASDSRNIPRLGELVAPGPGRDAALEDAEETPPASSTRLQVAGFKVNSYDGQEAVIDVVWEVTSQNDALVSSPTVLHWVDGDWLLVVDEDGKPPIGGSQIENLGGYIPWSGI